MLNKYVFEFSFSQFPKKKTAPIFPEYLLNSWLVNFYPSMIQDRSVTSVNLTIGRDRYFKTIKIDKKENLQALIYLLDQAVKDIESQFGKEFKLPMKRDS